MVGARSWLVFLAWGLGACSSAVTGSTASTPSSTSAGTSSISSSTGSSGSSPTAGTSGSTSTGTSSSGSSGSSGSSAGQIAITVALALDASSDAPGQTVHGTVTYGNVGGQSIGFQRALITARPPGGTHAGGPFDDLAPALGSTTLAPGQTATVDATYTLSAAAATGTWEVYATYEDSADSYHDGPSVFFDVSAADAGSVIVADGGYTVVGNTIYDANGQPHLFHGVDRTATEWSSTGYQNSLADYQLMHTMWHANVVRVPLNQDFWLPGAAVYDANYPSFIAQNVAWAEQAGMDVILDLHWSDTGDLTNASPGQQKMADANSVTLWTQVASAYKNDPRVIFELYNEPHDVSFDIWRNGGPSGDGWTVHGMQELYDTVRGTGANNLVLIGGLDWAYDLSGVATDRITGTNIVYVTHPYDYNNTARPPSDWDRAFGWLTTTDPVIATEFGTLDCGTDYVDQLLAYADAHNMSWTAWAWWPPGSCAYPQIISDWTGTPSPGMGEHIYEKIISY